MAGRDASVSAPGFRPHELTSGGFGTAVPEGFLLRAEPRALKLARPGSPSFPPSVCPRRSSSWGVPAPAAFAFSSPDPARFRAGPPAGDARHLPTAEPQCGAGRAFAKPGSELPALSNSYSGTEHCCKCFKLSLSKIKLFQELRCFVIGEPLDFLASSSYYLKLWSYFEICLFLQPSPSFRVWDQNRARS